jgi:hypothetical protein
VLEKQVHRRELRRRVKDAHETDVDCGGGECQGCALRQELRDVVRLRQDDLRQWPLHSWQQLRSSSRQNPVAPDGVYQIDVDGAAGQLAPFSVYCDMTMDNGGWTRVGFEPAGSAGNGIQGGLAYLGVEVGDPDKVANQQGTGLFGSRFSGKYTDLAVVWGTDYIRMTPARDVFVNEVDLAIPVTNFVTSSATMLGWVMKAGARSSAAPREPPPSARRHELGSNPLIRWGGLRLQRGQLGPRGLLWRRGSNTSCNAAWGGGFSGPKTSGNRRAA